MGLYLNSNALSVGLNNNLSNVSNQLQQSLERLSTGLKINHASDGAATLITSELLQAQINGTTVAQSNVQQGTSMLQTADSALQQISGHLQNLNQLALEGSNGTFTAFSALTAQISQEFQDINVIASSTYFGSANNLLNGTISSAGTLTIQAGPNSSDAFNISAAFATATADALGLATSAVASTASATALLGEVTAAINTLGTKIASVGSYENMMQSQSSYLTVLNQNMTAANASIMNTDVATEMSNETRLQVVQQAGAFAVAQANSMPSLALKLLQ